MRKLVLAICCGTAAYVCAFADNDKPQDIKRTKANDRAVSPVLDGGWVVGFPTGSSDYFNSRYEIPPGQLIDGTLIGSADFGSDTSYPVSGLFDPNLSLDSTGNTPDLSSGVTSGPVPGGGKVFDWVFGSFGGAVSLSGSRHVVLELPPGDSGLLGPGADTTDFDPATFDGWSLDGYVTKSNDMSNTLDWGLGYAECFLGQSRAASQLRQTIDNSDPDAGDFISVTVGVGDDYGWYVGIVPAGARWVGFLSRAGLPLQEVTPVMPTIAWGNGCWSRVTSKWPFGAGGLTLNFVVISATPGVRGSVEISNEVTVNVLPDPECHWGIKDDGTFESGWVVSIPTGSSDFFSNWFGCFVSPGVKNITDMKVAVMDFSTTATAYPLSGVFAANPELDPAGWTPDLSAGFGVHPFTFPAGVFASTSGHMIANDIVPDIPYDVFPDDNIHGVIQFPPGDSGLLGCGGDTTSSPVIAWGSTWTLDGYATPSNRFDTDAGWGIRLGAN